jgi:AcrR family transcriptional regulator
LPSAISFRRTAISSDNANDSQSLGLETSKAILRVFLREGFHQSSTSSLAVASDLDWADIASRFGDKEGLFYAALDVYIEGLVDTTVRGPEGAIDDASLAAMLQKLRNVSTTSRFRIIHKAALLRLNALAASQRSDRD